MKPPFEQAGRFIDPDSVDVYIDREQAFLLYATFCGDLERTSHALGITPVQLLKMVDEGGWNERLAPILKMKKSQRPGDVERAINRALNFVQAHGMRTMVNRVLKVLLEMSEEEIRARTDDYGSLTIETAKIEQAAKAIRRRPASFSRFLADLSSALEKCQAMSYQALNDTVQERTKRKEEADGGTVNAALHAKIAEAMAGAKQDTSARAQLFDGQLLAAAAAKVQQRLALAIPPDPSSKPEHPNDNDDH